MARVVVITVAKRWSGNIDAGAGGLLFPVIPGLNTDCGEAGLLYLNGVADSTDLSRPITWVEEYTYTLY
jgi:hypothetical protein